MMCARTELAAAVFQRGNVQRSFIKFVNVCVCVCVCPSFDSFLYAVSNRGGLSRGNERKKKKGEKKEESKVDCA